LEYKAKRNGAELVIASRWFPSSKMCSVCGLLAEGLPYSCGCGDVHGVRSTGRRICVSTHSIARFGPEAKPVERKLLRWSQEQRETGLAKAGINCVLSWAWIEQPNLCCRTPFPGLEGCFRLSATLVL
jgi:hypothetical protein